MPRPWHGVVRWIVLTLLVLGRNFLVQGRLFIVSPSILTVESRLLSLKIHLNLSLFHLLFHFSVYLEELAFGE